MKEANLGGRLNDSFIAVCPQDDGTVLVRRVFYADCELPDSTEMEVNKESHAVNGIVALFLSIMESCFGLKGEWVKET